MAGFTDPPVTGSPGWSPGILDVAETFAESGVTVSTESTSTVSNESIGLADVEGSTASIASTSTTFPQPEIGPRISPNTDLAAVEVVLTNPGSVSEIYARRVSDSTTVLTVDGPFDGEPNQRLVHDFVTTEEYDLIAVFSDTGISAPYNPDVNTATSDDVDITTYGMGDGSTNSTAQAILDVTAITDLGLSGSATVSWPEPSDLSGWDIVPYQATEDGGTIQVYAEDQDGNELAGPLNDPGDISPVSRSENVRIRVDLSRPDTSSDPRLESVYRRYKV